MDFMQVLRGAAATITVVAAILVALNVSSRVTVIGFYIFIVASVAWMIDGWLEDKTSLLVQNAILLIVNIAGVIRYQDQGGRDSESV